MKKLVIFLLILFVFPASVKTAEAPQIPLAVSPAEGIPQQQNATGEITRISELMATVTKVVRTVNIRSRGALFWHDAKPGEILKTGTEIVTKEDGKIEFVLDNGNVVKLKPNTRLIISNITQNNITGEYENFFEASQGKIWTKIQKIQGNSSFKVKTPTAIAGARGTIIYLVVFPDSTMVLFQEGKGFFVDSTLGQTFEVEPGRIYELDNQGNISGPVEPSSAQLQELMGGWDMGAGAEGYSPPPGGAGNLQDDVDDTTDGQNNSNNEAQKDKKNSEDYVEPTGPDFDGDGIPDATDPDDDNDGIFDIYDAFPFDPNEWLDTDNDGEGNNADTDDDDDGISDVDEAIRGTHPLLVDTDGDGIRDDLELNTDNDGLIDDYDDDDDNDGMTDVYEIANGLNQFIDDTSGDKDEDGLTNLEEFNLGTFANDVDSDDDNYTDKDEYDNGTNADPLDKSITPPDNDTDYLSDLNDPDDDNDGISDALEEKYDLDPMSNDTDEDGLTDGFEAFIYTDPANEDTDEDGLSDAYEIRNGLNERGWHTDEDGATDTEEIDEGTNPHLSFSFPHGLTYDEDLDGRPNNDDEDKDGDWFANETEYRLVYDEGEGENRLDPWRKDSDGDGVSDWQEARYGLNPFKTDTDGDGIGDKEELELYWAGSELSDIDDTDTDGDGISDTWEDKLNENSNYKLDKTKKDTDDDGLDDMEELCRGTDPNNPDTDGDGLKDGEEGHGEGDTWSDPLKIDSDEDGATDKEEIDAGTDPDHPLYFPEYVERTIGDRLQRIYLDTDGDGIPNGWDYVTNKQVGYDWDDDGDGISNETEIYKLGTSPNLRDSDGDGVDDGIEAAEGTDPLDPDSFRTARTPYSDKYVTDTDGDGIPDQLEREIGLDPVNPDGDNDGLNDGIELAAGLDPSNEDTDGDGLKDGWEALKELNPFGRTFDPFSPDMDNDGLTDKQEIDPEDDGIDDIDPGATDPDDWDTDDDELSDGAELRNGSDPNLYDTDSDAYGKFDGSDREDAFPNSPGGIDEYGASYLTDDPEAYGSREKMREKRLELVEENELRQEIRDMLSDFSMRYNDSVMERISDAQTGKVMVDAQGYRVRAEQYVFRPNSNSVQVMNINLRTQEAGALSGLNVLDWKTTFNQSIDNLTGSELRNLPWGDYLASSVVEGQIGGGPVYGATPPQYYPTEMNLNMTNPQSDAFKDRRSFGSLYDGDGIWRQDITEQMYANGKWTNVSVLTNQSSGTGNPAGFDYMPAGAGPKWDVEARFYVIGDGSTSLVSGMDSVHFDTIWDAIAVNMPGHQHIGANNLEINLESKFGGTEARSIDLIYIPWERQNWRDNHSWRRMER